eukprot:2183554-Alexandrium_andersonii.AAC.1
MWESIQASGRLGGARSEENYAHKAVFRAVVLRPPRTSLLLAGGSTLFWTPQLAPLVGLSRPRFRVEHGR